MFTCDKAVSFCRLWSISVLFGDATIGKIGAFAAFSVMRLYGCGDIMIWFGSGVKGVWGRVYLLQAWVGISRLPFSRGVALVLKLSF